MYKKFIIIIHFSFNDSSQIIERGETLKTCLQQLGSFYPAFASDHCLSVCLKTDDHADAILKQLNQTTLTTSDKVQIFELANNNAFQGFSQLAVWL